MGKWRSVKIEERSRDEFFKSCRQILDTLGKGHTDAENFEIYGVTNVDSLRGEMQTEYDSAFAAVKSIETESSLYFKPDSSVIVGFPGMNETGKWHINTEGNLLIDETNKYGETQQLVIHIVHINPNELKLAFTRDADNDAGKDSSFVTYRREKN